MNQVKAIASAQMDLTKIMASNIPRSFVKSALQKRNSKTSLPN